MRSLVLVFSMLAGLSVSAQSLTFRGLPSTQRLSGRTDAVTVERLDAAGLPVTTGNTSVLVTAPAGAQVATSPSPAASWAASVNVNITPGSSRTASLYLRSGTRGPNTWTASGGAFTPATGVVVVRDDALTCDMESGTRLDTDVPPGAFNTLFNPSPAVSSITASMPAAHRGAFGLRLIDGDGDAGAAADVALYDDGAPFFGDYFARSWVRVNSSNGQGAAIIVQLTTAQALAPSVVDVILRGSDRLLAVGGFEADAGYGEVNGDGGLALATWQLLEVAALGVGTPDGGREVWVDGKRVASMRNLDFSAPRLPVARIAVGEPYAKDRTWVGSIDFDDVRSAAVPLASKLHWVSLVDAGFVGECLPLRLELRAAFNDGPAGVAEPFAAGLDGGGRAELFEDGTCGAQSSALSFPAGVTTVTASVRARAPLPTVSAAAIDFLPAQLVVPAVLAPALVLTPASSQVAPGGTVNFVASAGTGRGIGYRLATNASGSMVDAAGRYTAGPVPGLDEVEARDSSGQTALAQVLVVVPDAGVDAGVDAGAPDAGPADAGEDAGAMDAGGEDAGAPDAGGEDAGAMDAGGGDAGAADGGGEDAGAPDAGGEDAGAPDAGGEDGGPPDAGPGDAGADAGSLGPPRSLGVGCGCTGGGEALLVALVGAFLVRRRRVA